MDQKTRRVLLQTAHRNISNFALRELSILADALEGSSSTPESTQEDYKSTGLLNVLAENVQRLRSLKGLAVPELAQRANITADVIYRIEQGKKWPRPTTLDALGKGLGIPVWQLLKPPTE